MERKKWTPKTEITVELMAFREKRKWQLALRRYVLEKNRSPLYACYFGLDIEQFRKWISLQFTSDLNWEGFGTTWQFDHIVPLSYFDFSCESDLKLCWNFINISIDVIEPGKENLHRIDIIAAKTYFEALYTLTNYSPYLKMIQKISTIEQSALPLNQALPEFILQNKPELEIIDSLDTEEFNQLNEGMSVKDILLERAIIKKFG